MKNWNTPRAGASSTARGVAGAACAALLLAACSPDAPPQADTNAFVLSDSMLARIRLDTVRVRPVEDVIELNGRIAADENRLAGIYPIVGGQVISVDAELGDHVAKGQTLAVIRSSEVADMEHQLTDARSDVELSGKNLQVQQDLFATKLVSERDLVAAQQEAAKAQAQLKRMEETFSIYHFAGGSRYVVTAPIGGYIIGRDITHDETLPAGQDTRIFSIAELDEVWVLADVYESDIARVKEGMPAEISTLSYPDKVFSGKVDKIFNILDPRTRTMRIRVRLPNPGILLKPEMIARVRLTFQQDRELPAIPSSAVISDNSRQYVMVFKDRYNVRTREVVTDRTTGSTTWLREGPAPGEAVVCKEQLYLYDALNDK